MIHLENDQLNPLDQYKLISGSVVPRPIAWVTTLNEDQTVNLAPYSFFSGVAGQASLVSVSVNRIGGKPKDTARNLLATGEGVIHVVSENLAEAMNQTAATLPENVSEVAELELDTVESKTVAAPGLADALIRFEVKVHQHVLVKDDMGRLVSDLFILKVTDMYFDEKVLNPENYHIDVAALNPITRLAGPQYAELGRTFGMKRPK